jgi:HK97 gp10 family phage protein
LNGLDIALLGGKELELKTGALQKNMPQVATAVAMGNALVYERGMKRRVAVGRTGMLRNSIRSRETGVGEAEVGAHQRYAAFVEYGTGIMGEPGMASGHRITPIHAQALAWTAYNGRGMKNSSKIVVKSTAGMKAQPFVRPTLHEDKEAAQKGGQLAGKLAILKAVKGGI